MLSIVRKRSGERMLLSSSKCLADEKSNFTNQKYIIFNSPDRWSSLPEAAKDIPGVWGNLMTFLGGSRSCIGYRFALYEYVLTVEVIFSY